MISIKSTQLGTCYNILALQHQPFDDDGVPVSQTGVIGVVALLCRLVPSLPSPKLMCFAEKKFSFQESQNQGLNRFSSGDTAVFFLKQISLLGNLTVISGSIITKFFWKLKLFMISLITTRLIVINIALSTGLFCKCSLICNCSFLKGISFNTKCLLVWCD